MANDLARFRRELEAMLNESSRAFYEAPKGDQFGHGVQVGRAQQLRDLINLIDSRQTDDDDDQRT